MFTTTKRIVNFEFVRVIAMMIALIYYVYKAFPLIDTIDQTGLKFISFSVFYKLGAPLFLFLCGRFALNVDYTDKSLKEFYLKKIGYIIIPMAFFMTVHYALFVKGEKSFNFFEFLPYAAAAFDNLHYWFMFKALFYILSAPILALVFKDISNRAAICLICIGLIYNTCSFYLPIIPDYKFAYSSLFGNLIFYFFLGGLSDKIVNLVGKRYLYIAGIASLIVIISQSLLINPIEERFDHSPFYMIFALSIYVFLTSLYKEGHKIPDYIILFLGKYSFIVCMIQGMLIKPIIDNGLIPTTNIITYMCSGVAVLLLVSVVLSIFLDSILFRSIRVALYHLLRFYNNIK